LEIKPKKKLIIPFLLDDANLNLLSHVKIQHMVAVLMDFLQQVGPLKMVAWNTKLVKIQDMAVAEMVIQLLKEETMKVVPKTHVRTHCLDAVMMEKQLLLELGKTASVMKIKNVKLENLGAVLMEELSHKGPKSKDASLVLMKYFIVMLVRKQSLDAVQIYRMLQLDQNLKDVQMRMGKFMRIALSLNMVAALME